MKVLTALLPALFLATSYTAHIRPKTFLEAVEALDIESLNSIGSHIDHHLSTNTCRQSIFSGAIYRASELGFLEGLQILSGHRCSMIMDTGIWVTSYARAKQLGHDDVVKWILKRRLVNDRDSVVQAELVEAAQNSNLNLVKFFLLYPKNTLQSALDIVTKFGDEKLLNWLKTFGCVLEKIKLGQVRLLTDAELADNLIEFIFDPLSFGFTATTHEHLFKILFRRYGCLSTSDLRLSHSASMHAGNSIIANFIQKVANIKATISMAQIPLSHDSISVIVKHLLIGDLVAEVVKSQE